MTTAIACKRYQVQVGKGKSAYRTIYSFDTMAQAGIWYRSLNTHSGHKKRLVDTKRKLVFYRTIT